MKNDKLILEKVENILDKARIYVGFVENANPCAYTDRLLEDIVKEAKEIEKLHDNQFNMEDQKL